MRIQRQREQFAYRIAMPSRTVSVGSDFGLHWRPVSLIAEAVQAAGKPLTLSVNGGKPVPADHMMRVLMLGAAPGDPVTVTSDDEDLMNRVADLIAKNHDANFYERDSTVHRLAVKVEADDNGYSTVHENIRKEKGAPSSKSCVDCGKSAEHWTYNHSADSEKTKTNDSLPYSTDTSHYSPRCMSCHNKMDKKASRRIAKPFPYMRNNSGMRSLAGPDEYGQQYEPWGRYYSGDAENDLPSSDVWERGTAHFDNPLELDWAGGDWKRKLSDEYGGLTGKELSQALMEAGYDGVVTSDEYGPSEMVDIRPKDRRVFEKRSEREVTA